MSKTEPELHLAGDTCPACGNQNPECLDTLPTGEIESQSQSRRYLCPACAAEWVQQEIVTETPIRIEYQGREYGLPHCGSRTVPAAAPDLLEACRDLLYVLVHYNVIIDNETARIATHKAQQLATSAIARAAWPTGRSPSPAIVPIGVL